MPVIQSHATCILAHLSFRIKSLAGDHAPSIPHHFPVEGQKAEWSHGEYIGEITAVKEGSKLPEMIVAMIEEFLDVP